MKPTQRETAAAHALANALLEFAHATEEGRAMRHPRRPESSPQSQAPRPQPLLVSAKDAAAKLSVSPKTLYRMTTPRGPIPVVKIGRAVHYTVKDLEVAVRRLRQEAS